MTFDTAQISPPASDTCVFDQSWHATPNNVVRSCRVLLERLRAEEPSDTVLEPIGEAVTEAATNAVYHAYVGRRIGQFQITARILTDQIAVTVEDDGCGFDIGTGAAAGRGLPRIAELADRVETSSRAGGGTVTAMWFNRDR